MKVSEAPHLPSRRSRSYYLTDEARAALGLPPEDEGPASVPLLNLPWRPDARDRRFGSDAIWSNGR